MPQELLHLFDRLTLVNQKAACRMPQIMKANDWKVATLQDNTKPRTDVVRLIGFPVRPLADVTFLSKGHLKKAVVGLLLLFQRQQIGFEAGGQKRSRLLALLLVFSCSETVLNRTMVLRMCTWLLSKSTSIQRSPATSERRRPRYRPR